MELSQLSSFPSTTEVSMTCWETAGLREGAVTDSMGIPPCCRPPASYRLVPASGTASPAPGPLLRAWRFVGGDRVENMAMICLRVRVEAVLEQAGDGLQERDQSPRNHRDAERCLVALPW